jgi:hypothetical protein
MPNLYNFNSIQAKRYSLKPEYSDSVVVLRTAKGKRQIARIIKMSKYVQNHESEEDLWFKRFGIHGRLEESASTGGTKFRLVTKKQIDAHKKIACLCISAGLLEYYSKAYYSNAA